jgi:hypothetical protein
MHIVAIGYPSEPTYAQKKAAKEFYESFAFLIPCPVCREHYETHLQKNPLTPHLDRRDDLFRWTINVHNEVNVLLGKPRLLESEVITYYRRIGLRNSTPVINQDTLDEVDLRSMIRGGLVGGGIVFILGMTLWFSTKKET